MDKTEKIIAVTHPGTYIPVDLTDLARTAKERGVALEINEGHRNMSLDDVLEAKAEGASFLLSSDAHRPSRVGQASNSIALAREAGILGQCMNWEE